jgi:CheY-like chemotaxis protein/Tfp pilus assembly protein PilZ
VPLVVRLEGPGEDRLRGAAAELAAGGLFVRSDRAFTTGERLPLLLWSAGLLEPLEIEVQVAWTRSTSDGLPAGAAVRIAAGREEDRARLAALAPRARGRGGPTRTYRILLVEDNAQVEALYAATLRRLASGDGAVEVEVDHAKDGEEALLRLARKPRIDLVVTDLYMPQMDGFALIERIRSDPSLVMTPVVAITAGSLEARDRAVDLGVDVCLQKPVKLADILATLRALLDLD